MSPSIIECAGRIARASPSWATDATLPHSALSSAADVATTPIVVFSSAAACPASAVRTALRSAAEGRVNRRPCRSHGRAVSGSIGEPLALTTAIAPTDDVRVADPDRRAGRAHTALQAAGASPGAGTDRPPCRAASTRQRRAGGSLAECGVRATGEIAAATEVEDDRRRDDRNDVIGDREAEAALLEARAPRRRRRRGRRRCRR